jgi:two-component system, NtrC family, sensor kinase
MKILHCFCLCTLLSISYCFSEDSVTNFLHIDKMPAEGLLLDKGWKFHAGDDSSWANPEFNDKDWEPINPALDIMHIPQFQNKSFGWFRLKLEVAESLMDKPLGITLSQVGTSEIYLNGRLLYSFGVASPASMQNQPHFLLNRPFIIKLDSKRFQVISVRYFFNKNNFFIKYGRQNPCLRIVLNLAGISFSVFEKETFVQVTRDLSSLALWALLSIISISLYSSNRIQKAYLYLGLYSSLLFIASILNFIGMQLKLSNWVYLFIFISCAITCLSSIFSLNAIYLQFGYNNSSVNF